MSLTTPGAHCSSAVDGRKQDLARVRVRIQLGLCGCRPSPHHRTADRLTLIASPAPRRLPTSATCVAEEREQTAKRACIFNTDIGLKKHSNFDGDSHEIVHVNVASPPRHPAKPHETPTGQSVDVRAVQWRRVAPYCLATGEDAPCRHPRRRQA